MGPPMCSRQVRAQVTTFYLVFSIFSFYLVCSTSLHSSLGYYKFLIFFINMRANLSNSKIIHFIILLVYMLVFFSMA